jgi:hypothetical protein
MLPRIDLRLPLGVAAGIAVGAYLLRSVARGFDFRPDLPIDVVVLVLLLLVLAGVAWLRADDARVDAEAAEEPHCNDAADAENRPGPG